MTEFKPYPEYKHSGVEWIGDIPSAWSVCAFGRFARFRNGADYSSVEVADGGYPVYGSGGEFRRASEFLFDGESVLFGRKGTVDRPLHVTGRFWTVDTMYYTEIATRHLVPRFVYYWATQLPYSYWLTSTALPSMTQSDLSAAKIPYISIEDQDAIVAFLDRETAEIDAFIADKEELIGLLAERRAATISHAVTKGLDPSVPMKDSGESILLGDIPTHWEVRRLGSLLIETRTIVGESWANRLLLSLTLRGVIPRDMENVQGKLPADFTTYQSVRAGDLVFCLFDVEETPRTVGLATQDGMITGAYSVYQLRTPGEALPAYLSYAYLAYDQYKLLRPLYAGLRNTIRKHDFRSVPVALPPIAEQQIMVDHLSRVLAELEEAMGDAREAIALSRERRAALISAVVTGKIDVRGAV